MDELVCSTIMLTLSKSIYFNVKYILGGSYGIWQKLCDLYDKERVASHVYWMKKLIDLWMKEGTSISNHVNEFNTIFSELIAQKIMFNNSIKAMFLLVTLPKI